MKGSVRTDEDGAPYPNGFTGCMMTIRRRGIATRPLRGQSMPKRCRSDLPDQRGDRDTGGNRWQRLFQHQHGHCRG